MIFTSVFPNHRCLADVWPLCGSYNEDLYTTEDGIGHKSKLKQSLNDVTYNILFDFQQFIGFYFTGDI